MRRDVSNFARVTYRTVLRYVVVHEYYYYTGDCSGHCHDYQCIDCEGVENCEDTRCASSNDQYCVKCEFDRGGLKKAYDLVEDQGIQNRKCEQRCSWRLDSKFCYPGTCPGLPSTCSCLHGFYGNNCLKLTTNPDVENCAGKLKVIGSDITCDIDCGIDNIGYCQSGADSVKIDWTSSYNPSLDSIVKPYYVNDTGFGVVSAFMQWTITRDTIPLDSGISACLSDQTGIINVPANELSRRSCSHQIDLDLDIQHNDRSTDKLLFR
ncbi:uncharacterized protein [Ptychodera flava]|uniref:uncharacterized protein n=1 Tax=Ptychodera flava TaxID=63121 RepID=UPI00396A9DCA